MTLNLISISYKTGFYVKEKRQLKIHATGIDTVLGKITHLDLYVDVKTTPETPELRNELRNGLEQAK